MTYEIKKKLQDAGYSGMDLVDADCPCGDCGPSLSELIEACGDRFSSLTRSERNTWYVASPHGKGKLSYELVVGDEYSTPEEAVANLWLALNKKDA